MSFANPTDIQATKYAEHFVVYGDKTKALRNAFPESKAKPESQHVQAVEFHNVLKVQLRIEELQKAINDKANEDALYTVEQALIELEEARQLATIPNASGQSQTNAMVAASMGKAKIAGLLVDKVDAKVEATNNIEEYARMRLKS